MRLPAAEVVADQLVQEVEKPRAQTEDDVGEDVEHHLLENTGSVLFVKEREQMHLEKVFLVNWKTLQTIRHHDKQDGGSAVDQKYPNEEKLPGSTTLINNEQTNTLMQGVPL